MAGHWRAFPPRRGGATRLFMIFSNSILENAGDVPQLMKHLRICQIKQAVMQNMREHERRPHEKSFVKVAAQFPEFLLDEQSIQPHQTEILDGGQMVGIIAPPVAGRDVPESGPEQDGQQCDGPEQAERAARPGFRVEAS